MVFFVRWLAVKRCAAVPAHGRWKRFFFRVMALLALYIAVFAALAGAQFSAQAGSGGHEAWSMEHEE